MARFWGASGSLPPPPHPIPTPLILGVRNKRIMNWEIMSCLISERKRIKDKAYSKQTIMCMHVNPTYHALTLQVFQSSTDLFYAIEGAPDFELSPPKIKLKGVKIFLQSTSQGSRCLKKGTTLLYKKVWYYNVNASCMQWQSIKHKA